MWESLYNSNFNYGEFAIIKSKSGLNTFKVSVKEFAEKTNAISLQAKPGRYGGGVQYPNKVLTLSKQDEGIYYHGSPYKIDTLKEGFDFTPFKELTISFGSKPSHISINEGKVSHDGIKYLVYLYQIDEVIKPEEDFINHPNSAFDKGMEFRTKRDLKLKLIDVINE